MANKNQKTTNFKQNKTYLNGHIKQGDLLATLATIIKLSAQCLEDKTGEKIKKLSIKNLYSISDKLIDFQKNYKIVEKNKK